MAQEIIISPLNVIRGVPWHTPTLANKACQMVFGKIMFMYAMQPSGRYIQLEKHKVTQEILMPWASECICKTELIFTNTIENVFI